MAGVADKSGVHSPASLSDFRPGLNLGPAVGGAPAPFAAAGPPAIRIALFQPVASLSIGAEFTLCVNSKKEWIAGTILSCT
jgi:hypothetical protein